MSAPWTLAQAREHLAEWLAAESAVAANQAYTVAGRSFTRADARTITEKIRFWKLEVARLSANAGGGINVRLAVPRDNL